MDKKCPLCGGKTYIEITKMNILYISLPGPEMGYTQETEPVTPETHCICMDGPLWKYLMDTEQGRSIKMREAVERFPSAKENKQVAVCHPTGEFWVLTSLASWKEWLSLWDNPVEFARRFDEIDVAIE